MRSPTSVWKFLVATTAMTFLSVRAERTENSFFSIEGEGVRIASDGSVCVDAGASGPVRITARSGWLVNGRESVAYPSARGLSSGLILTSKLGEDHSCCPPPPTEKDEHDTTFVLEAEANPTNQIAMYALPSTSAVVTASAESSIVEKGRHKVTTTWQEWTCPVCGAHQEGRTEVSYYDVEPDTYEWMAEAAGVTQASSTWTGPMSKGTGQEIEFTVTGRRNSCQECEATATDTATADVHELSVERPDYLGLDRTDAGLLGWAVTNATAHIDPEPASATYNWTKCGKCQFDGKTDEQEVTYGITNSSTASTSFLAEELTVTATASNAEGLSASATCTTNFTVVAVDVQIGSVGEDKEETEGAFLSYVPDANGVISVEGTNKMVEVKFTCKPTNLPANEMVTVSHTGQGELYQKLSDGKLVKIVSANYFANEISQLNFAFHGHAASTSCMDGEIRIEHPASGAKDLARYTVVKVNIEITDFPTKELLDEDDEEMPGAFIPYAADWTFGEEQSNEEDIPFGPAAQNKLVDVYVSYEPANLPEDECGNVKFLEFDAPPDSLYLPANSANVDQRWMEFVNWWNTRPPNWGMTFEGKKRLVLHGHEKSGSQRDREIRVTHPRSGATDAAKYTVFHVDLDIDSDNDLSIENEDGFEDAIEEREPGKIISYDQSGIRPGQDYRVPLRLEAWGGETNAVVRLDADSSPARVADIYNAETGGDKIDLPCCFSADSIPPLYVDGITNGTVAFTATLINPPEGVSATALNRPISGLELAEDKVAALVIQPISFAPSGGAAVWSSIPNDVHEGDGVMFDTLISNQGYRVAWYRDPYGERDVDVGRCTANAYLNLDGYGAVTIISHGDTNEHLAVYFPRTADGYDRASRWIDDIGNSGGQVAGMSIDDGATQSGYVYYCVSVGLQWFEDNWKNGFDKRNSIVLWGSCYSATLLNCCGGRWRSGYRDSTDESECVRVYDPFLSRMNGSEGFGRLRPSGLAYSNGRSSFGQTTVQMEGNQWTTLCPAPIVDNPTFPSSNLAEGEIAFGCLVLDTFIKSKNNMIQIVAGEGVSDIAPLRQEGAAYPFGAGFHVKKGAGNVRVRSEARRIYIESATPDGEFSSGKTMDADCVTPNGGIIEWEF